MGMYQKNDKKVSCVIWMALIDVWIFYEKASMFV